MTLNRTNVGVERKQQVEADVHDAAYAKLSLTMKEFLVDNDPGGFSAAAILDAVRKYGERGAMKLIILNRNLITKETYGEGHPQFDPKLPVPKK